MCSRRRSLSRPCSRCGRKLPSDEGWAFFSPTAFDNRVGTAPGARRSPPPPFTRRYSELLPSWRLASNRNQVRRSVSSMKVSSRPAVPESS